MCDGRSLNRSVPLESLNTVFPNRIIVPAGDHELERPDFWEKWFGKAVDFGQMKRKIRLTIKYGRKAMASPLLSVMLWGFAPGAPKGFLR